MVLRENEDNAYANFWGDRQRASLYEHYYGIFCSGQF